MICKGLWNSARSGIQLQGENTPRRWDQSCHHMPRLRKT
jgi:hypothetical protein